MNCVFCFRMDPLSWKITNVESLICWVIFLLVMENQERFEKFVTFFNFRKKDPNR